MEETRKIVNYHTETAVRGPVVSIAAGTGHGDVLGTFNQSA